MSLISRLKALLGLDGRSREPRGTTVTVEREPPGQPDRPDEPEPEAETERAVKESPASGPEDAPTPDLEPEAADEPAADERADEPVQSISGIGPAYADRLAEAGVHTVGDLAAADAATLGAETGLGEGRVSDWIERARAS